MRCEDCQFAMPLGDGLTVALVSRSLTTRAYLRAFDTFARRFHGASHRR